MIDQFANLRTGFRVSRSCGPESLYEISIKFGSLEAMDAADDELRAAIAAPAAAQEATPVATVMAAEPVANFGLSAEQLNMLRTNSLKPEEISGAPNVQLDRVRELVWWFARLADNSANSKWTRGHAFELAYYVASMDVKRGIDLKPIRDAAYKEGCNITPAERGMLERVGFLAATPAPEAAPSAKEGGAVRALVAEHARLIEQGNNYAYFELAYTRQTGWMAWITDKPLTGGPVVNPDRKVLFQGQGASPEEACRDALKGLTPAGGDRG